MSEMICVPSSNNHYYIVILYLILIKVTLHYFSDTLYNVFNYVMFI